MVRKNDDKILELKKVIEKKKEDLKKIKKFSPVTNLVLHLEDKTYNLNVLDYDSLRFLLIKLNSYLLSAHNLSMDDFEISGYLLSDWLDDIRGKILMLEMRKKETELKMLENKLESMLSDDKKTELELEQIAEMLK